MERPEEFIEAYLANQLSEGKKEEFETSLVENPLLQNELKLQSSIINSIKKARAKELKTRLNTVSIKPSAGLSITSKIGLLTGLISLISILYYLSLSEKPQAANKNKIEADSMGSTPKNGAIASRPEPAKTNDGQQEQTVTNKPKTKPNKNVTGVPLKSLKEIRKPVVIEPTLEADAKQNEPPTSIVPEKNSVIVSNISVENDTSDNRYTFHYKFHKGKLILYGAFDNSLYEILEINGKKRVIFLYYKEQYYLLDENQKKVKMLEPIKDSVLLEKLTEYRLAKK